MRRDSGIIVVLGLFLLIGYPLLRSRQHLLTPMRDLHLPPHRAGTLILAVDGEMSEGAFQEMLETWRLSLLETYPDIGAFLLGHRGEVPLGRLLPHLRRIPHVRFVSPDHLCKPPFLFAGPARREWAGGAMPQEPFPVATLPLRSTIPTALLSSPVDLEHPALQGLRWLNPGEDSDHDGYADPHDLNGLDDDGNGFIDDLFGWNFVTRAPAVEGWTFTEPNALLAGTAMGGLLATGFAHDVGARLRWMPLSVFAYDPDRRYVECSDSTVIPAILYAVRRGGRIVVVGVTPQEGNSPALQAVFRFASDTLFILPAMTEGVTHLEEGENLLRVAALDASGERARYVRTNAFDLAAPGEGVVAPLAGGGYAPFSGNGIAALQVARAAVLLASLTPDLSATALKRLLVESAAPLAGGGKRLDLPQAISNLPDP
ncbi:MAG: hypothetical protein D6812_11665 [Deltaproteobacteria bacterium]|nr:MAG: hypothetical protein D6812_11665 [Deltaproteobacteria bacterium]